MEDIIMTYKRFTSEDKQKYWQKHIDGWLKSGQSQLEYCRNNKIKKSTLGYWRTRLSREDVFIEIPIELESHSAIEIILKNKIKIQVRKGFDPQLLIQTIKVLEEIS